nr:hypothetical protein [Tanacetum cinerariifolium]
MLKAFPLPVIGSLMYLTASRPDIMFAICACARHQVTPKDSLFDLVAYSDSDYSGATQDRKSTTRGCQFFGRRLISWQCKKQTIVATSTTKAKYVVAASGCGQVLWIQNQLLDYGHHFIRDCFEKKLISVDHIHTDDNVVDLLTKPFDAGRFQYLVSQQRKPLSKKQQREFYMSVLRNHSGWKTKHFKGMTLEEIREKFILVWKQIEDFVPMAFKEEGGRFKRKGLRLEQDSAKKMKTSKEVSEEDLKAMMQLVLVEEVYVEALQVT